MDPIGTQEQGVSTGSQVLASFTFDSGSLTDYSAEITWGDGTSSVGQITAASGGGGNVTGSHTYTAAGSDVIGVTVAGDSEVGAGSTQIAVVEPPPTAYPDSYTIAPGQALVTHTVATGVAPYGVLANDVDSEGQPLSATVVSGVQRGSLAFNANGTFTYTPAAGFVGTDSFRASAH